MKRREKILGVVTAGILTVGAISYLPKDEREVVYQGAAAPPKSTGAVPRPAKAGKTVTAEAPKRPWKRVVLTEPDRSIEEIRADPFLPLIAMDDAAPVRPGVSISPLAAVSSLRLEGIVLSAKGAIAIINGAAYVLGDAVRGFTLAKILKDRVIVESKDDTFVLELQEATGGTAGRGG